VAAFLGRFSPSASIGTPTSVTVSITDDSPLTA